MNAYVSLSAAFMLSCSGCPSKASNALSPDDRGGSVDAGDFVTEGEYEILPVDQRYYLPDGDRDFMNQYSFAVMVKAVVEPHEVIMCSGTLLSPRLVLTAGHCVCGKREMIRPEMMARALIDSSSCARDATLVAVTYAAPAVRDSAIPMDSQSRSYEGTVRPHPGLEIFLDERGMPISSKADLAVISLDRPVEGSFPAVRLPTSDVRLNEAIRVIGYGFNGKSDLILGLRRSGRKKVTRLATPGSDRISLEQTGPTAFTSGSGEPCLRQEKSELVIVGVTTMDSEEETVFTSTYPYRDWLLSEIHQATSPARSPEETQESTP